MTAASSPPDPATAPPPPSNGATAASAARPFPFPLPHRPQPPVITSPPPPSKPALLFSAANRAFAIRTAARSHSVAADPSLTAYIRSPQPVVNFPASRPIVHTADQAAAHAIRHALGPQQQVVTPRPVGGGINGTPAPPPSPRPVPVSVPTQPKVASFPTASSAPEFNSCKERENREDNVVTIRGRKVRILDDGSDSLYALCRSWLRNGLPQDTQPNIGEGVQLLPRPLPASLIDSDPSKRSEGDNEDEDLEKEEHVGSVDQLTTRDLLEGLVKRSKRVRAQFRKERIRRIARYNQRLSLLLPPVEMNRSDAAPGS